jgi:hypothetical protein
VAKAAIEQAYDASGERLFDAVMRTVSLMGYSTASSDSASRKVMFNTGLSSRSWAGQDMTVTVLPEPDGSTKLVIGGTRGKGGLGGGQLTDWGEAKKITRKFLATLAQQLASTEEPRQP